MENVGVMREIKVRLPFRILGGFVSAIFLLIAVFDPHDLVRHASEDLVNLGAFLTVPPLFLYVTITGKLPDRLVAKLPQSLYDDLAHAETIFTRFDVRSVVAALVVLLMGCYKIMAGAS